MNVTSKMKINLECVVEVFSNISKNNVLWF